MQFTDRRLQGLYDELQNTVWPHIEFIQGIPAELADDTFISPKENSIIVLDDLMSTLLLKIIGLPIHSLNLRTTGI